MGEGLSNPPKPKLTLRELAEQMPVGMAIWDAVDHFIQDHLIPNDQFPTARNHFEKLYDAGVFLFEAHIQIGTELVISLQLLVWDGTKHVDVNEMLTDDEEPFFDDEDYSDDCET